MYNLDAATYQELVPHPTPQDIENAAASKLSEAQAVLAAAQADVTKWSNAHATLVSYVQTESQQAQQVQG